MCITLLSSLRVGLPANSGTHWPATSAELCIPRRCSVTALNIALLSSLRVGFPACSGTHWRATSAKLCSAYCCCATALLCLARALCHLGARRRNPQRIMRRGVPAHHITRFSGLPPRGSLPRGRPFCPAGPRRSVCCLFSCPPSATCSYKLICRGRAGVLSCPPRFKALPTALCAAVSPIPASPSRLESVPERTSLRSVPATGAILAKAFLRSTSITDLSLSPGSWLSTRSQPLLLSSTSSLPFTLLPVTAPSYLAVLTILGLESA